MSSQDNKQAGITKDDTATRKLLEILKEPVSLHLMMLLIVHRELSLSQMTDAIGKSKPTVHRRLQAMIDCGLVVESREEHVRGNIPAKFYRVDETAIGKAPGFSKEQIDAMNIAQKAAFYQDIRDAVKSTIIFSTSSLDAFSNYLDGLDPRTEIVAYFDQLDFYMNMSLLTENQYKRWMELYRDFIMKIVQMVQETQASEAGAEKTYLNLSAMLPVKRFFGLSRGKKA